MDSDLRGQSLVDLGRVVGIDLDFFFYYSKGFGGGTHTPLKLLAKLGTDFWGLRVGIGTVDLWDFDQIGYVIEFGAGSW